MTRFLAAIPRLLGGRPWILFLLLLLVYLCGFGALGIVIPAIEPTANAQLILGNLTNVVSALAAGIAAAAGTTAAVTAGTNLHEGRVHRVRQHLFHEQVREHLGLTTPEESQS